MKAFSFLLVLVLAACSTVSVPDGYRMNKYKAPVPTSVPGALRVNVREAASLKEKGVIFIDVIGSGQLLTQGIEDEWLVVREHLSIPESFWLPDVGRGALTKEQETYFTKALFEITKGNKGQSILFYCLKSCWMSWNAAKRSALLGYKNIYWFADGKEGWASAGYQLSEISPFTLGPTSSIN